MRSPTLRTLAFVLLATAAGCESVTGPRTSSDAFRATWEGERFQGSATAHVRGAELHLLGWEETGSQRAVGVHIHITDFTGAGSYSLDAGEAAVEYVLGGDAVSARYATAAAGAGTLVVDRVTDGRISGSVRFEADFDHGTPPIGDRGRFEGAFEAVVQIPLVSGRAVLRAGRGS